MPRFPYRYGNLGTCGESTRTNGREQSWQAWKRAEGNVRRKTGLADWKSRRKVQSDAWWRFCRRVFFKGGGGGRRPAPVAFLWYVCLQVSCLRPCLVANGWTVTPLAQTDGLFQSEVSVWLSKHVCDKQRHARFFGGLPPSSPIGSRCGTRRPPRRQGVLPPLPCSVPCRTCPCAERP